MNIYANQLSQNLKNPCSMYVLLGQDPFLLGQSLELLRSHAKTHGFEEKQVFTYEGNGFDWQSFIQTLSSPSMFAPKQVIEWVWQSAKFNDSDLNELQAILPPPADTLLIVRAGALTKAQQNAKWFKKITGDACLVSHWPPRPSEFPQWIAGLAKQKGLSLDRECCQFLATMYEGRLDRLAGHLDKVALCHQGAVNLEVLHQHLDKQYDFDVFSLQSAIISGHSQKVVTVLSHLKQQKTELSLLLWCVTRLLESLYLASQRSQAPDKMWLRTRGIWANEHTSFSKLVDKLNRADLPIWLASLQHIDKMAKTGQTDNAWQQISTLCIQCTGAVPRMA